MFFLPLAIVERVPELVISYNQIADCPNFRESLHPVRDGNSLQPSTELSCKNSVEERKTF